MKRLSEEELVDFCIRIAEYIEEDNIGYAVILARKAIEPDPIPPVPQPKKPTPGKKESWGGEWGD